MENKILLIALVLGVLAVGTLLVIYCPNFQDGNANYKVNFKFEVVPCNNSYASLSQIISNKWEDDKLVIGSNISTYCEGATISGDYAISGDNMRLYYKINKGDYVSKCVCTFQGAYSFSNISKKDYKFELIYLE